tara:strand:- start:376 stop:831 length:456 start_codon:yes stop_codon:yes gene_type:complete
MEETLELQRLVASVKEGLKGDAAQLQHLKQTCRAHIIKRLRAGEQDLRADFSTMKLYAMQATFYERAAAFDLDGAETAHAEWKTYQSDVFDELHLFRESTRNVRMFEGTGKEISGDANMAIKAGDAMLFQVKKHESVLEMIRCVAEATFSP